MIGIIYGTIVKSGSSQYGHWAVVAEPEVTKQDGGTFTPKVMCNSNDAPPADGTPVLVQGFARAEKSERDGNTYANLKLSACRWTPLAGDAPASAPAPKSETFEDFDPIPF